MSETLEQARRRLEADGVRFLQIEASELDGALRGKLVAFSKGLSDDVGFCTTLLTSTTADDVYEAPFASFEGGFRDFFARPQVETIRRLPWRPRTAAVICDMYDADGTMTPESPRTALHRAVDRAAAMGFEPRVAIEYDAAVFEVDGAERRNGASRWSDATKHGNVRPVHASVLHGIAEAFAERMDAIGASLESSHITERRGALAFSLEPAPALDAADRAMRAKTYLKELCSERGHVASFMARPDMAGPWRRGHVRQSLWCDGECAFEADGGTADIASHFAAGQRAHLAEVAAFCTPTINAYRRAGPSSKEIDGAGGSGHCGRSAAMSPVVIRREPSGVFVENRLPGADTNAYLTTASLLAAGLDGIVSGLREKPHAPTDGSDGAGVAKLPASLEGATDTLDSSAFLRSFFGDRFVDHYAYSRRVELRIWKEWLASRVTDWELRRYFETV